MGFSGCLSQETVWIGGQIGMVFHIGDGHIQNWCPGV